VPLSDHDVRIVIALLGDPDPQIAATMGDKLFRMGKEDVRRVMEVAPSGSAAHRETLRLMRRLRAPSIEDRFRAIPSEDTGDLDLEAGALAISRFGHPDLTPTVCTASLDYMAAELAPNIAPDDHPVHAVRTLNEYLFEQQGFCGEANYAHFPDPDNSYLNRVLERKMGLPISLAVVYILLARRVDLPIAGVNLPVHFVVRYAGPNTSFYIDPFNGGRILTVHECCEMVGKPGSEDTVADATNRQILTRTMANLFRTYTALGDGERAESSKRLIAILQRRGVGG